MKKRKMSYVMSCTMILVTLCIGLVGCSEKEEPQNVEEQVSTVKAEGLSYTEFKKAFQIGALQSGEPFSLADSLIQEGSNTASMQVFFTDNSSMVLYMTPKTHILTEISVSISPKDTRYAYAVLWSLEQFSSVEECKKLFDTIMEKPVGEKIVEASGFRYSHPENTDSVIGFTAINTNVK